MGRALQLQSEPVDLQSDNDMGGAKYHQPTPNDFADHDLLQRPIPRSRACTAFASNH